MKKVKVAFEAVYAGADTAQRSGIAPFESRYLGFDVNFIALEPPYTSRPVKRVRWWTEKKVDFLYGQVVWIEAWVTEHGNIQRPKFLTEQQIEHLLDGKCITCKINPINRQCELCNCLYDVPPT